MAAIAQTLSTKYNVAGSVWERTHQFCTIANSGDTLVEGLTEVISVDVIPDNGVTGISWTPGTPGLGQTTIAFTATGTPLSNLTIIVRGK